ncbi:MAG: acylneuraminate cytidylyltransferase family protein [Muribaculaceae bacterium]|nr:acylneuraminate cytidylyltransferase family protein [Muribaculaceae bacterium]
MKTLFIIPARGGSKGIPRKNVRNFCGKPLITRSVEQALALSDAEDICVTTDDPEIAEAAAGAGVSIPFMRPAELAGDTTPSRNVLLHALDFYSAHNADYDRIVLLQPTSPLRNIEDIRNCIAAYDKGWAEGLNPDMAVCVTEAEANPYYNAFEPDENGMLHVSKGAGSYTRRQDAPKVWQYTGAVYVINADSLRKMQMSAFPRIIPVEMPRERGVDLDTEADWMLAEYLFKEAEKKKE